MRKPKRGSIPFALRTKVRERDEGTWCAKCGEQREITYHHIVAVQDGGEDELDNIVQLCGRCHGEWHRYADGNMTFEEWLQVPPLHFFLATARAVLRGDLKSFDYEALKATHEFMRLAGKTLQGDEEVPARGPRQVGRPRSRFVLESGGN